MEIQRQCEFAISGYNDITPSIPNADLFKLFHSLQSFLIAAANISKILWPALKYSQRGLDLRNLLTIDDSSPLKTRDPRNIFEHFDERLEDWFMKSPHHMLMDMNMGNTDEPVGGTIENLRYFNIGTYTFSFRGEKWEIKPLYDAVTELLTKVNNELTKWLPRL